MSGAAAFIITLQQKSFSLLVPFSMHLIRQLGSAIRRFVDFKHLRDTIKGRPCGICDPSQTRTVVKVEETAAGQPILYACLACAGGCYPRDAR